MKLDFTEDLEFISENVSTALNIFNDSHIKDNQLYIKYGDKEFIYLQLEPMQGLPLAKMKLRTLDMSASWKYVPVGFSQINESRGLFNDIRRAAHPSPKKNSMWYIQDVIKEVIGDNLKINESFEKKGYLYVASFTNGYKAYITLTMDDNEYRKEHRYAALYSMADKNKKLIGEKMTADECIMLLLNIATQTDIRMANFIHAVNEYGGKVNVPCSYRLPEETADIVRAVFPNKYAMKLKIINNEFFIDTYGRANGETYVLSQLKYKNFGDIIQYVKGLSELSEFVFKEEPKTDTQVDFN